MLAVTFFYKFLAALIIFGIALVFGLLPLFIHRAFKSSHFLIYSESLARGIFLGAGLIHLLPDAERNFQTLYPHAAFPLVSAVCALAIIILYFIEQGLATLVNRESLLQNTWMSYLLLILLSIHSILAGIALGVDFDVASFIILFFAIITHKGAAAFALSISMYNNKINNATIFRLILLFSCMTPFGILFGSYINHLLQNNAAMLTQAIFNALAAGTFIYIALFDRVDIQVCEAHPRHALIKSIYFVVGTILMAVVAIWV